MMNSHLGEGDHFLEMEKCNEIINELIAVLSGRGLPISFAEHLLMEAKNELRNRVTV